MTTVALTEADDGRTVEVTTGDELVVRLPENPTTGFRWEVDRADDLVGEVSRAYVPEEPPLVGSGGLRELRFQVTGPGTGRLALKRWRSWEGDASVVGRFGVEIASRD